MSVAPRALVAVLSQSPLSRSTSIAKALGLPLLNQVSLIEEGYLFSLQYQQNKLVLQSLSTPMQGPVLVDFESSSASYRRNKGGGELIVKAVGGSQSNRPHIFDATAGLGRDSFVLASAGCRVTLCERSSVVASLLRDGLTRFAATEDEAAKQIVANMQFNAMDSISYLSSVKQGKCPDVVYIDPMFPPSKKSALVKKEMRVFHQLVGEDQDSRELLEAALQAAIYRVVVKRSLKSEFIADKKPTYSLSGKAIRFDIYTLKRFK